MRPIGEGPKFALSVLTQTASKTKIMVTVMPSCGFLVLKAESQGSPFPILKCCVSIFGALFKINCLDIFKLSFVMISSRLWAPGSQ